MAAGRDSEPLGAGAPRVPTFGGHAWSFTDNLRAVDVLPLRFAALPPAEAARRLFADLDAQLAARLARGDLLVAGHNVGCGANGAAAAAALHAAGIAAVVAASFAGAFDETLLALGVPPLAVDAPAVFHTGQRVRVNVEAGTIANLSSGDRQPIRNLTEPMLERLRSLLAR